MSKNPKHQLPQATRRAVLRGAGVAITLPLLESLLPRGASAAPVAGGPTRFVGMIHPNGFPYKNYDGSSYVGGAVGSYVFPGQTGSLPATLPKGLKGLSDFGVAGDVQVIGGLEHDSDPAGVGGTHQEHTVGRVLVGKNLDGGDVGKKVCSLDVAIHKSIGSLASRPTERLTLGTAGKFVNGQGSGLDDGLFEKDGAGKRTFLTSAGESVFGNRGDMQSSGSYKDGVAQDSIKNPRLVFNKLFCGGDANCPGGYTLNLGGSPVDGGTPIDDRPRTRRLSVLHYVNERVKALKNSPRIGANDKQKVDQYLSGIEDIEARLNGMAPPMNPPPVMTGRMIDIPSRQLFRGIPSSQNQLGVLMVDLIVKAFEANIMNVASLMLGATDGSNIASQGNFDSQLWYNNGNSAHDHKSSHGTDTGNFNDSSAVSIEKVKVFAYLVKRLKEVDGESGKLFGSTVVYYGSDFGDGHQHEVTNPLVMLATGIQGLGVPNTYRIAGNKIRPVRVMVSVAEKFGAVLPQANGQGGVL
jgi:Protein of unknown function (DUF1552)